MEGIEVNRDPDIDPLFGNIHPQDPDVLWVSVTPKVDGGGGHALHDYYFILIIPTVEEQDRRDIIADVMQDALTPGDTYSVKAVNEKMAETFAVTTPILSFDQKYMDQYGDLRMVWLRPPVQLMQ